MYTYIFYMRKSSTKRPTQGTKNAYVYIFHVSKLKHSIIKNELIVVSSELDFNTEYDVFHNE